MTENIPELENLFTAAQQFVDKHYMTSDGKDRSIKILATINQLIELKKSRLTQLSLELGMPEIEWVRGDEALASDIVPIKKREQKGQ
jgi:hypothetical protein